MNRKTMCTQDQYGEETFVGWFDLDAATTIASYKWGNPYESGKILLATKMGKMVVNRWNNSGMDIYRFADDEKEIAEILSRSGYADNDEKLVEILEKYQL